MCSSSVSSFGFNGHEIKRVVQKCQPKKKKKRIYLSPGNFRLRHRIYFFRKKKIIVNSCHSTIVSRKLFN